MKRLRCDYPQCKRIIVSDTMDGKACTSCGHGHFSPTVPKAVCGTCSAPIYDNVNPNAIVICSTCVENLLAGIQHQEGLVESKFNSTKDMKQKLVEWDIHSGTDGGRLKVTRKRAGLSMDAAAAMIGVSRPALSLMERNVNPLTFEATEFIQKREKKDGPTETTNG